MSSGDLYVQNLAAKCNWTLRMSGNRTTDPVLLVPDSVDLLAEEVCRDLNCGGVYRVERRSRTTNSSCFHGCSHRDHRLHNCSESVGGTCSEIQQVVCGETSESASDGPSCRPTGELNLPLVFLRTRGGPAHRRSGPLRRPGGDLEGRGVGDGLRRPVGPEGRQRGLRPAGLRLRPERHGSGRPLPPRQRTGPPGRAELHRGRGPPVDLSLCTGPVRLWTQGGRRGGLLRSDPEQPKPQDSTENRRLAESYRG